MEKQGWKKECGKVCGPAEEKIAKQRYTFVKMCPLKNVGI